MITLEDWHKDLFKHFKQLESKRQQNVPIFAIEHDLDSKELVRLKKDIEEVLKKGLFSNLDFYMPWVVYSTERGYEYSGDEYWPTFKEKTNYWIDNDPNRKFIKNCFLKFEQEFRTIKPVGDWATHFNIISRPIINSILPKDIQFYLLRILFNIRSSITSVHLEDIVLLGKKIQENCWSTSSRFQMFAQNTALLGQFTKALLDSSSNIDGLLISEKTFIRIENDLSLKEKDKIFLHETRKRISLLKLDGIRTKPYTGHRENIEDFYSGNNKILSAKPLLYLSSSDNNSWNVILTVPVMTFLLKWSERFAKILYEGRVKVVNSTKNSPFPARNLLYRDNEFILLKWPETEESIIEFFLGHEMEYKINLNNIYDNSELFCFQLNSQKEAVYVSHKMLESKRTYIFLYTNVKIDEFLTNCEEIQLNCTGIKARKVEINKIEYHRLKELGFNILRNITFKPIAFPASNNDCIGVYEYSSKENPTFLVVSDSKINKLKLELSDDHILHSVILENINPKEKKIIELSSLTIGNYYLKIEAEIVHEENLLHTNGLIEIYVRDEDSSLDKIQTPLQLYISPTTPTLEDFWEMKYGMKLLGPKNYSVIPEIVLLDRNKETLFHNKFNKISIPIDQNSWYDYFLNLKKTSKKIEQVYEDSYYSVLIFSNKNLGRISHSFERSFTPIRWLIKQDKNSYMLKLICGADIFDKIKVLKFDYSSPNTKQSLNVNQFSIFNPTEQKGGLYLAEYEDIKTGFIVPPCNPKSFQDLTINFDELLINRNIHDIVNMVNNAFYWSSARQSGNPLAFLNQMRVYFYLTDNLFKTVCGDRWIKQEKIILNNSPIQFVKYKLIPLLQNQRIEKYLYDKFDNGFKKFVESEITGKIEFLEHMFNNLYSLRELKYLKYMSEDFSIKQATEFILRFANDPQHLVKYNKLLMNTGIKCLLEHPILLKIGRSLVIYARICTNIEDRFYWGWEWN